MPATHRRLELDVLDHAIAEIRRLQQHGYEQAGRWTLGQTCHHLAFVMRGSLDGFPPGVLASPVLRFVASRTKRFWIDRPIPKGVKLRGSLAALVPPEPGELDESEAVQDAIRCFGRLTSEPQRHVSPVAGELTREQWDTLHRRHAAHHLGFLTPRA